MHSGNELLPILIYPLMMKRMIIIGEGKELHKVKLSPTMKGAIINVDTRARPIRA